MCSKIIKNHSFLMAARLECTPLSVSDYLSGSINSLYDYLNPEQRKMLSDHQIINNFCNNVSAGHSIEALVNQEIGFTTSLNYMSFSEALSQQIDLIVNTQPTENWHFYIDGFAHSGKTTVLSILALECIKNLIQAQNLSSVFIFPLNWQTFISRVTDINSLYCELATHTINMLSWQRGRAFTVAPILLNWLLTLPFTGSSPPLPSSLKNNPFFPISAMETIGSNIVNAFKNGPSNVKSLLNIVTSLPSLVSTAFGFRQTFFIYDNIDICSFPFTMSNDEFNDSAMLIDAIVASLVPHLFAITVKTDAVNMDELEDSLMFIDTSDLIPKEAINLPKINISNPKFTLMPEMCHGSPQILNIYKKVVEEASLIREMIDSGFSKIGAVSSVELFQKENAKSLLLDLLEDLSNRFVDGVDEGLIEKVRSSKNLEIDVE